MQSTVIEEFMGNPCVEALVFQQGDATRETYDWAQVYWQGNDLRNGLIWDDDGALGRDTFDQPQIGIPFGRHFIFDANGNVAHPFFGHDPRWTIERMYELYGGDCDGDSLHDAWEAEHFGDLAAGPTDDADGDGATNAAELQAGTDPRLAECDADTLLYVRRAGPESNVTFTAAPVEWWRTAAARYYAIEGTIDVRNGAWADVPGLSRLAGPGLVDEPVPSGGPLTFYRLASWVE
jgi:hypothetical protein